MQMEGASTVGENERQCLDEKGQQSKVEKSSVVYHCPTQMLVDWVQQQHQSWHQVHGQGSPSHPIVQAWEVHQ